jgi:prepilin-type N-terminal cleavage/methylation domain-containing protein
MFPFIQPATALPGENMRKAFTLIELLVVIAIIAILAAILFPVFAQAKGAAKKTVATSNQKQLALGILMYSIDYDDMWPRTDGCELNSSLNPALNDGTLRCGGAAGFGHRMNAFSWQKWPMAYIKNRDILEHPMRQKDPTQWTNNGQIVGGFALNTAVTGQLDTYNRAPTFARQWRDSWLGGSTSSTPTSTALLLEIPNSGLGMVPGGSVDSEGVTPVVRIYPPAIREFWRYKLMDGTVQDCVDGTRGTQPDSSKIASGGITLGLADGSARFVSAGRFLASTPSKQEYLGVSGGPTAGWTFQNDCVFLTAGNLGFVSPNTRLDYPMWGLTAN